MLIIGAANLIADGLSMGVGNYLSIRSHEGARAAQNLPEGEFHPARHGVATLLSLVAAGAVPLAPFAVGFADHGLAWSCGLTFAMMFVVGALRSLVTIERWWTAGLEMLLLGMVVALAAFGSGRMISTLTSGS
jgi:vacuolar iron transporter family protein